MRFEPRFLDENVNVSRHDHGREFLKLAAVWLGILFLAYLALGLMAEQIAVRLPHKTEKFLGAALAEQIDTGLYPRTRAYVQGVLDRLVAGAQGLPPFSYRVDFVDSSRAQAVALPAGRILISSGLLSALSSENALAMVLAHELGHYASRDHLRGIGRSLVVMTIGATMALSGQSVSFLFPSVQTMDLRFSREQEERADAYALGLVFWTYGHAGGVVELYDILEKDESWKFLPEMFLTHPYTKLRRERIREMLEGRCYPANRLNPLPEPGRLPFKGDARTEGGLKQDDAVRSGNSSVRSGPAGGLWFVVDKKTLELAGVRL